MADKPNNGSDSAAARAMNCLPTLQQNALRKIFDRPEFSPAEVAALGYRRLQQAEGIGQNCLQAISAWLQAHGCEPKPQTPEGQRLPRKTRGTSSRPCVCCRRTAIGYSRREKNPGVSGVISAR